MEAKRRASCLTLKRWMSFFFTVKPVTPKCSLPKSVPVGKAAELGCVEDEGFPKSQYQWFHNNEEIPDDPKTSPKFFNSSYVLNSETGTLVCVWAGGVSRQGGVLAPGGREAILGRQLMV